MGGGWCEGEVGWGLRATAVIICVCVCVCVLVGVRYEGGEWWE